MLLSGSMDGSLSEIERCELLLNAIREVIGQEGTLFVPAFSLSFLRNEAFDPDHTPAVGGEWNTSVGFSEYIRCQPGVVRSMDPNFSVCGLGPEAGRILRDLPATTYGPGCFYQRIMQAAGKICCIGTGAVCTSFLHYAEETLGVPYRYKKLFTGSIRRGGETRKQGWISSVPIYTENGAIDGTRVATIARQGRKASHRSRMRLRDCDHPLRQLVRTAPPRASEKSLDHGARSRR